MTTVTVAVATNTVATRPSPDRSITISKASLIVTLLPDRVKLPERSGSHAIFFKPNQVRRIQKNLSIAIQPHPADGLCGGGNHDEAPPEQGGSALVILAYLSFKSFSE